MFAVFHFGLHQPRVGLLAYVEGESGARRIHWGKWRKVFHVLGTGQLQGLGRHFFSQFAHHLQRTCARRYGIVGEMRSVDGMTGVESHIENMVIGIVRFRLCKNYLSVSSAVGLRGLNR